MMNYFLLTEKVSQEIGALLAPHMSLGTLVLGSGTLLDLWAIFNTVLVSLFDDYNTSKV